MDEDNSGTPQPPQEVGALMSAPDLADALESPQFRRFLDQVPIAIAVSEMGDDEVIVYANPEFERLSGLPADAVQGKSWVALRGRPEAADAECGLGDAITQRADFAGTFWLEAAAEAPPLVDVYSNVIADDAGTPCYRLAALVDVGMHAASRRQLGDRLAEKETLLLEIQHRVRNNLQLITALIRIEARNARGDMASAAFDRLAGRIESIQLLYTTLVEHGAEGEVDLGLYISEIATSVLRAHAVEGIRLDLQVDTWPVSVNVAMPTGLVVNELLTNALKHAFAGRNGGTIKVHSLADATGCRITIADDGIGLPPDAIWPKPGKLSALIVQSLRVNAKAQLDVWSAPGQGMRVTITFLRQDAAPEPQAAPHRG